MNADTDKTQSRCAGRKVAMMMIAFFAVFIIVDIAFVTLALRTHRGVVAENAYEQGLHYNDIIKAARDAAPPSPAAE